MYQHLSKMCLLYSDQSLILHLRFLQKRQLARLKLQMLKERTAQRVIHLIQGDKHVTTLWFKEEKIAENYSDGLRFVFALYRINPTDNPYEEQHLSMGAPSPNTSLVSQIIQPT